MADKWMFCKLLIFAMTACSQMSCSQQTIGISWQDMNNKVLKSTFDLSQELYRNKEYILIISDIDGEQRELSRFLRNERNPFTEPNNRFRLSTFKTDNETGILIIDLPLFNEFKNNIVVDISNAFTLKLILSLADRLKIVLVMPDDIRGDSNAVKKFLLGLMKLVETLDENYISFLDSTMVVGTMTPKNNTNPEETKEDVKNFSYFLLDYLVTDLEESKDSNIGNKSLKFYLRMKHLISNIAIGVFKRQGRNSSLWSEKNQKELRHIIFDKLSFSAPVNKDHYQIVLQYKTLDYISNNPRLFKNKKLMKRLSDKIIDSILEIDFYKGNDAHLKMLSSHKNPQQSLVTSFYDIFTSRIQGMTDKQFYGEYLSPLDARTRDRWYRYNFELEKLRFFNKIRKIHISEANLVMRNIFVDEVDKFRQIALETYGPNESQDISDAEE
ncbi:Hypothetical predicted protein [Cloeon dipterum]|nr:Hypothetical predicted protein [Cloeon dipterum]